MKKILLFCLCFLSFGMIDMKAQTLAEGKVKVENLNIANNDGKVYVSMDIDRSELKVRCDKEVVFTPMIVFEDSTVALPNIYVAGRTRYFRHLRSDMRKTSDNHLYRGRRRDEIIHYQASVDFRDWMNDAELVIRDSRCGCLSKVISEDQQTLMAMDFAPRAVRQFIPETYLYEQPVLEAKHRALSGSAFIDFPVNITEINKDYRNNAEELNKIIATIDDVKNDKDANITSITIKGFASPEGKYSNNERLAKNRTAALKKYVQELYSFPEGIIATDYEVEDWEGLKKYVEKSSLENRDAILEIINSDLEPDTKDWRIKLNYPEDYKLLLAECYPALRHSDYVVSYNVRNYTDIDEAKKVMAERPGNLSPREFYMVANSYPAGSEEFNETFETMIRIYPEDATANLNAANAAMGRGDLEAARKYIEKAGKGPKVDYARGILEALEGNYATAWNFLKRAKDAGIAEAQAAMDQIHEINR